MNEPYRTLFAGPLLGPEHWLLAPYLDPNEDEPDWLGLAGEERLEALSTGEKILLDFAAAFRNVQLYLDPEARHQVMVALYRVPL